MTKEVYVSQCKVKCLLNKTRCDFCDICGGCFAPEPCQYQTEWGFEGDKSIEKE